MFRFAMCSFARIFAVLQIKRRVDERNMGKRLRKVPDEAMSLGIVLFREQTKVVA